MSTKEYQKWCKEQGGFFTDQMALTSFPMQEKMSMMGKPVMTISSGVYVKVPGKTAKLKF